MMHFVKEEKLILKYVVLMDKKKTKSDRLLPCVYYIHGGGMIAGNNHGTLQFLVDWIIEFNIIIIISVGLLWTGEHAEDLVIDVSQITVADISAAGGLAAAVALNYWAMREVDQMYLHHEHKI